MATAASSVSSALSLVQGLTAYSSIVSHVAVSNEPDTNFSADQLTTVLLPAIKNVRQALAQLNLNIRVTIPFTAGITSNTYPPSAGQLNSAILTQLKALLQVIADDNSYVELNVRVLLLLISLMGRADLLFVLPLIRSTLSSPGTTRKIRSLWTMLWARTP